MCTPSGRSSTSTVTGAKEPASGTRFAISCMMSGLPMMRRTMRGVSRPVALQITAPWSSSMKRIRPVLPSPLRTALSSSTNVRAADVVFAKSTMLGLPTPPLIAANTSSNCRDEVRLNRSTSILVIIATYPLFRLDEAAEGLGPPFLEVSVPLQSALQHCLYSVLGFGPSQRCPKRSEGIEEPVGRRQRNLVDEILRGGEGSSIEGGDPAREGVDEAVQFGVGKRSVDITVSFRGVTIEVVGAENDFERPAAANQMGQALCASTARMQTDTKLGMAESRVLARREAHVAGEDELAADAAGAAPDFCDADSRRLREPHERIDQNG